MEYKCSYCNSPAQFYLRVGGMLKGVCLRHYGMIRGRRIRRKAKDNEKNTQNSKSII